MDGNIGRSKAKLRLLGFLCCFAYFTSYITRINYAAVRLAIADELALTHPELLLELGIAISAASLTYGLGQLVSGFLGDRFHPIALVGIGLGGATLCNLLMPLLYPSVYIMALVWGINGFFQALIRPPLGRIIAASYDEKGYINTCVWVSNSSQIATVMTYLLIPLCLHLFDNDWRFAFYLPVVLGLITLGAWLWLTPKLCGNVRTGIEISEAGSDEQSRGRASFIGIIFRSGLYIMILPVLIHGLLRDGITAWMPDFISEVGGLETGISILTTAILPIFCIVTVILAKSICARIGSDGKSSALFFGICTLSAALIVLLLDYVNTFTFFVIVLLMALITGCMHAVNHIYITRIPGAFKKVGRVSGIVGVLNALTYIGGALSPYAVALVAGEFGWSMAVLFWTALSALGTLLCILSCRKWNKFKESIN